MSLVNQMLQDLEHRRSAEARVSPLGGLSASGVAMSTTPSINYLLLGTTLMLAFVVVFVLIYLFGLQRPMDAVPLADLGRTPQEHSLVTPPVTLEAVPEKMPTVTPVVETVLVAPKLSPQAKLVVSTETVMKMQQPAAKPKQAVVTKSSVKKNSGSDGQENSVKTATTASSTVAMMNDESEDVGSVSIVELTSTDSDAVQQSATTDRPQSTVVEAVNKTIRPLSSEQQAQIAFQQAVKLLGRGKEAEAENALEKALSHNPVHQRARETLAALLLNTGRVSEAADSLREGLRLQPRSAPLAELYARVLVNQGDNDAAVAVMERARPSAADEVDYYVLLAALYRGAGKYAQAVQIYEEMLKARPGVAAWWMGLALSQDAMGESEQALTAYQRAQRAGGLKPEVQQYVQVRIDALTPSVAVKSFHLVSEDGDGFED